MNDMLLIQILRRLLLLVDGNDRGQEEVRKMIDQLENGLYLDTDSFRGKSGAEMKNGK